VALPPDFAAASEAAWKLVQGAPGFLTEREARFLALLAAATPVQGTILEIGSFKGKSTVALASIAQRYGLGKVVAVDPFTAPASTDPKLHGADSTYNEFSRTLAQAGLTSSVEVHRRFSHELAPEWQRPIRVLWIDGDHTYLGAKADLDMFGEHVVEGGVIAFHDVLHNFVGPILVFVEEMLRSDRFGPAGFCGSIGWAQVRSRDGNSPRYRKRRLWLARRAARLAAISAKGRSVSRLTKLRYQLHRARVPHGAVDPGAWAELVAL
jgi:predicted O-methyltransferase YrrM